MTSLAPRFVGKFQKGVDYMGDLAEFERELERHVAIMRRFGDYKLSIHTGSDKFSIYPIIARHAGGLVHVKTAGTSYLEALRVIAHRNPDLMRRVLEVGREHFEQDRHSYYIDARLDRVPQPGQLADADLPGLLDEFDSRQVLHVTFGSILDAYGPEIKSEIARQEADYAAALETHFTRHVEPFI